MMSLRFILRLTKRMPTAAGPESDCPPRVNGYLPLTPSNASHPPRRLREEKPIPFPPETPRPALTVSTHAGITRRYPLPISWTMVPVTHRLRRPRPVSMAFTTWVPMSGNGLRSRIRKTKVPGVGAGGTEPGKCRRIMSPENRETWQWFTSAFDVYARSRGTLVSRRAA